MDLLRRRSSLAISILILALAATVPPPLFAQDSIPSVMERTGTFRSTRIQESSGVAVSRRHPGVLWTHNDSGDKPVLYAINAAGELLAAYQVVGARAQDWEDIALARCPDHPSPCLYIADTGDNSERRKFVSIYVVPEPDGTTWPPAGDSLRTAPAHELRLRYPDGRHDVEAIFVDPKGNATLVSKGRTGVVLRYLVPRSDFSLDSATATLVDTLPITPQLTLGRLITGAAISPSGRRVVLRTYSELYFFKRSTDGTLRPDGRPCWLGAAEPQGEGVAFLDEENLVLTSESLPNQDGTLYRVRCSHGRGSRSTTGSIGPK
jgi:hypothetical protein